MAEIRVLPKEISELIAAGEVVERPASVIKELVENSIDAGATSVTVEIANGGITYMRVTDNGRGMSGEDVKTAFLRHATSKIKTAEDLDEILTLGFRGEALASISAVSRVEVMTARQEDNFGTALIVEGGVQGDIGEVGCPKGTTIIVRDLFYNVPARMKFLKKDVSEANTVAAVMDRMALSHPEVAFRFIRDGKNVLNTSGDGNLKASIYSVLGREFTASLIPMQYSEGAISVEGFVCTPSKCRPNRNGQFFFLNGRFIKSGTISAALDQSYKNSSMVGKFPAAVIKLTVPPSTIDVNVHPTKTEVRFSEEKRIFDLIYRGTLQAIMQGDMRPEMKIPDKKPVNLFAAEERFVQLKQNIFEGAKTETQPKESEPIKVESPKITTVYTTDFSPIVDTAPKYFASSDISVFDLEDKKQNLEKPLDIDVILDVTPPKNVSVEKKIQEDNATDIDLSKLVYVGEAFSTYIIVSVEDKLFFIDKHAAHERINFERLKETLTVQSQMLLSPISVTLLREEYDAVINNLNLLEKCGFMAEDFGDSTVLVRAVPSILDSVDLPSLIREIAENLTTRQTAVSDRIDDILHSIACKSAIKAGNITSKQEQITLAATVLKSKNLMYCPHGRPIAIEMKKSQIEKQFGRIL